MRPIAAIDEGMLRAVFQGDRMAVAHRRLGRDLASDSWLDGGDAPTTPPALLLIGIALLNDAVLMF
ncbi:hypothetical protein BQ8794_50080 [Mesorhizobium prunaredense]|uniref:Uncharacterized protein n=1 Tax=Mesorhizobium prunaredense TaxID=1631249 RepID=A0A1R3VGJ8_9HYPH|nr:hypothetical protein BQ8794_50080 [Mesorhizobium prunaredense]